MAYIQIDDKLSGWLVTRQNNSRKTSIKKVINKLQELSYGLIPKNLLEVYQKDKIYRYSEPQQFKSGGQPLIKDVVHSKLKGKTRPTTTKSFQSQVLMELKRQKQVIYSSVNLDNEKALNYGRNATVQCLKARNYEMPRPKTNLRQKFRFSRSKPQTRKTSPLSRKSLYETRRQHQFKRKPTQPQPDKSLKCILRQSMIRLTEDNLKVRSYSRSSQIN